MAKYFARGEYTDIPKHPFYVMSTDTFMSDWGFCVGKTNICIVPCEDRETAEKVRTYVKTRNEQKDIFICQGKIPERENVIYSFIPAWVDRANGD